MREIRFRGKNTEGRWIYGIPVKTFWYGSETVRIIPDGEIYGGDTSPMYDDSIIPETIGQYTGLKDKNGKEIYEGDVVRCIDPEDTCFPEWEDEVEWDERGYWTVDGGNVFGNMYKSDQLEIIGNIHEEKGE